mmetsp:Transcript_14807/g.29196  ORF Transcript_14807/g.29196 Transcript_14807/m.29196 type:complete len:242 (-) Transcript_14807:279-1004(-)
MKTFFSAAAFAFVLSPENAKAQLSSVPQRLRTTKQYMDINEWGRQLEEEIKAEEQRKHRDLIESDVSMSMSIFMSIPSSLSFNLDIEKEEEVVESGESDSILTGGEDETAPNGLEQESSALNEETSAVESTAEEQLIETEDGQSSAEFIIEEANTSKQDETTPEEHADADDEETFALEEEGTVEDVVTEQLDVSKEGADNKDDEELKGEALDQHLENSSGCAKSTTVAFIFASMVGLLLTC